MTVDICSDILLNNKNITCNNSACTHQYQEIRKYKKKKLSLIMQQQIKVYEKLLGKLKYTKRMKEELSEWRDLYHANGW